MKMTMNTCVSRLFPENETDSPKMMQKTVAPYKGGDLFQMTSEEEWLPFHDIDWSSREINLDGNWRFFFGEARDAHELCFDDSGWRCLSLPHDYSIVQPYSQAMEAQSGYLPGGVGWYRKSFFLPGPVSPRRIRVDFDGVYMNAAVWINGRKLGTHPYGYSPFSFDLTPHVLWGQENVLSVKVDHKTPSSRWYSGSGIYRRVSLTLTDEVHVGFNGVTVTTPKLEQEAGGPASLLVHTVIENESASPSKVTLRHRVYEKGQPSGACLGEFTSVRPVTVLPGESAVAECGFTTSRPPLLWSPGQPAVYTVETEVLTGDCVRDCCCTDMGFRFFHFDQDGGFFLNGTAIKLKGVCMHHDQGALGAAAHRRAMERQLGLLTDMGCNSIRVTHNPASKSLVDLCSQKGILMVEELFDGWHSSKNGDTEDYGKWFCQELEADNRVLGGARGMTWAEFDLKAAMKRDINAPCIFMWSLGNEVMQGTGCSAEDYPEKAAMLIQWAKETDSGRPVTTGDDLLKSGQPEAIRIGCLLDEAGGAVGFNYTTLDILDHFHKEHPTWKIYGSETASSINSRGVYKPCLYDRQYTSFDESAVAWGHYASQAWYDVIRKDYVAGTYVWTGFDYIGEPTNYNGTGPGPASLPWPSPKNSYFGIIDTAGFPKDSYYLYQSLWNPGVTTLHILPAWSKNGVEMNEKGEVRVAVYTNARTAELLFTPLGSGEEVSLGRKTFSVRTSQGKGYTYQLYDGKDSSTDEYRNLYLTWSVPYEDGTLTARGFDEQGHLITNTRGRSQVTTPDRPAMLRLTADREAICGDGKDLCYITADIVDRRGNPVPDAGNSISFQVRGNGEIVGVDNGLSVDHGSYQSHSRNAFNGKALVIVRGGGRDEAECGNLEDCFILEASASGMEGASVNVKVGCGPKPLEQEITGCRIVRNYYVPSGSIPHLPKQLTVTYSDKTTGILPVVWENMESGQLTQAGSFALHGAVGGLTLSIHIHMVEPISSILNYSAAVTMGTKPVLPLSRPAIGSDGRISGISLPVLWDESHAPDYAAEGIVLIQGRAAAFGRELPVTAAIRVQARTYDVTANVAPKSRLSQTVPPELASGSLSAITGNIDASGPRLWSNRRYTQSTAGSQPASIIFTYDTQELLGRATIDFCSMGDSLRFPEPQTTRWFISNTGPEGPWTLLDTRETVEAAPALAEAARYAYDFEPVMATCLRLEIHNSRNPKPPVSAGCMASTGIANVELWRAGASFAANSSAEITSILLNGTPLPADAWRGGDVYTAETTVESLEIHSDCNAAITILPVSNKTIYILAESEDHAEKREYRIHLDFPGHLS